MLFLQPPGAVPPVQSRDRGRARLSPELPGSPGQEILTPLLFSLETQAFLKVTVKRILPLWDCLNG